MAKARRSRSVAPDISAASERRPSEEILRPVPSRKLRVFVSWSGARSQALGLALRSWLPLVFHDVDVWLSQADIDAGDRWAEAVATELEASSFGIICVSRESAFAPRILFEAGALAKSLQASVIPLLLDLELREISGPLAQFQAKKVDKAGLQDVVLAVNRVAAEPIPTDRLNPLLKHSGQRLRNKYPICLQKNQLNNRIAPRRTFWRNW